MHERWNHNMNEYLIDSKRWLSEIINYIIVKRLDKKLKSNIMAPWWNSINIYYDNTEYTEDKTNTISQ